MNKIVFLVDKFVDKNIKKNLSTNFSTKKNYRQICRQKKIVDTWNFVDIPIIVDKIFEVML